MVLLVCQAPLPSRNNSPQRSLEFLQARPYAPVAAPAPATATIHQQLPVAAPPPSHLDQGGAARPPPELVTMPWGPRPPPDQQAMRDAEMQRLLEEHPYMRMRDVWARMARFEAQHDSTAAAVAAAAALAQPLTLIFWALQAQADGLAASAATSPDPSILHRVLDAQAHLRAAARAAALEPTAPLRSPGACVNLRAAAAAIAAAQSSLRALRAHHQHADDDDNDDDDDDDEENDDDDDDDDNSDDDNDDDDGDVEAQPQAPVAVAPDFTGSAHQATPQPNVYGRSHGSPIRDTNMRAIAQAHLWAHRPRPPVLTVHLDVPGWSPLEEAMEQEDSPVEMALLQAIQQRNAVFNADARRRERAQSRARAASLVEMMVDAEEWAMQHSPRGDRIVNSRGANPASSKRHEQRILRGKFWVHDACVICLNGVPEVGYSPCQHLVVCVGCQKQMGLNEQCPICRADVLEYGFLPAPAESVAGT